MSIIVLQYYSIVVCHIISERLEIINEPFELRHHSYCEYTFLFTLPSQNRIYIKLLHTEVFVCLAWGEFPLNVYSGDSCARPARLSCCLCGYYVRHLVCLESIPNLRS